MIAYILKVFKGFIFLLVFFTIFIYQPKDWTHDCLIKRITIPARDELPDFNIFISPKSKPNSDIDR